MRDAVRVAERELNGGRAPGREPKDGRLLDLERVQQRDEDVGL
jgi:hypothetical protein